MTPLFKRHEDEIKIDETEATLLLESFESQIESFNTRKQAELQVLAQEIRELAEQTDKKKKAINEKYTTKLDKLQQLVLKIRKGVKHETDNKQTGTDSDEL